MRVWGIAVAALCAFGLVGCSASDPPAEDDISATVAIHSGEASVETEDGSEPLENGDDVVTGDVVTTSGADAIVELAWSDGAITRLGPDTSFTVGQPTERLGARGTQAGGVSWNRIAAEDDPAAGPYVVRTDEGDTASDQGDLFVIDCRGEVCRVVGTGGTGGDGSKTTFRRGGVDTQVTAGAPAVWGELMGDEWAERNAALDEDADLPPVADLFAEADPSRGLVEGTFDVLRTGRGWECTGGRCGELSLLRPGETRELVFRFFTECSGGAPCAPMVDTQTIDTQTGEIIDSTVPLIAGATTYAWGTDNELPICRWTYADGTTEDTGLAQNQVRWEVTPTKAEVIDGVYRVTELTGSGKGFLKIKERTAAQFPGCETLETEWNSASDFALTWAGR